jgi:cytochrome P450
MALGNDSVTAFRAYLKELVADRRRHPGDPEHDVLTRLLQGESQDKDAVRGGQLSESELLQNCIFILNAGHETTTNLIGNALVALQEWPWARAELLTQMQRLAHDASALDAFMTTAVDEFLRFESSNQLGNRRARKPTTVGGIALPTGALVTLCIGAANRDPAHFDGPHKLDIHRAENRHLAFGLGIHQCAGLSLARLEGRIAIGRFLARFPDYRLTAQPVRGGRARFRGFLEAGFAAG